MKYKKNFPNWMTQCVFVRDEYIEEMNGSDYDIFLWLIYNTDKQYSLKGKLTQRYLYTDIKKDFTKLFNTNSIKKSLSKLNEIEITVNYLKSYDDKQWKKFIPFQIDILVDEDSGKSNGFEVTVDKVFIDYFNNPNPKVTLNYSNITSVKSITSKLLYSFLRDAYGKHNNKHKVRIVNIDKLRLLLNISNGYTSNSVFLNSLKKSIDTINTNTDIYVSYKKVEKLLQNGKRNIDSIKFTISLQIPSKKIVKPLSSQKTKVSVENKSDEDTQIKPIDSYDKFIDDKVDEIVKSRHNVRNIEGFKNKVKSNIMDDEEVTFQYQFQMILDKEKDRLLSKTDLSQPSKIILTNGDDTEKYTINNKYEISRLYDGKVMTNNIDETFEFYENKMVDGYYWDILKTTVDEKYKVSIINSQRWFHI